MAAVKELSVKDKLKQLYVLQKIDSKLDEINIMRGELPAEVSDLEDEIAGLELKITKLQNAVDEINNEINNHKANVKESENLIGRYTKQLDDVKNNREFEALNKEIELQNLEIELSKKKQRDLGKTLESREETLKATKANLSTRKKDLDVKKKELVTIIEKTEKEEADLIKESDKERSNIEARLLKAYDKIRKTYRNGLAVVPITREACGGCFNKIPPQVQIEIGIMKNIIACEHCGRVLVDDIIINEG